MTTAMIAFIDKDWKRLYRWAYILALIMIVYNSSLSTAESTSLPGVPSRVRRRPT